MLETTYPLLCLKTTADGTERQEVLTGSGQVVTAPEPVGGEPERFVTLPGVEGLCGSSAPGAPGKSRRGGGDGWSSSLVNSSTAISTVSAFQYPRGML